MTLQRVEPELPMTLVEKEEQRPSPAEDSSLKRRLQGLLFFRLLLGIFFLLLTIVVQSRRERDLLSAHLQPLYFFSCILFLFTIVAALSLKRVHQLKRFAYFQLFFDVEAVTFLIFLSGGVDSLFSFLYMPVIISASLLLFRRGSILTASVCSLSYGFLLDLQYFDWVHPLQVVAEITQIRDSGTYFHSILMNIAVFYLVAFLSGYLAEELQRSSQQARRHIKRFHRLEMLHENIVRSMSSGLLTISPVGYVLFANQAARRILGFEAHEIQGRNFRHIFPSLDPSQWPAASPVLTPAGPSLEAGALNEVIHVTPSDEKLTLGYTVSVLQGEDGEDLGWIFIFQDMTRLKAMEERVHRMERLVFAGRIAAEIAHEIKNPLAAVSGAVQMLQSDTEPASLHAKLLNIMDREVNRIDELVTDFLWLAKGSRKPEKVQEVSICAVIQEVFALLEAKEALLPTHLIETEFDCTPTVCIDPHHFRQILWNLLINSMEAMPQGGKARIRVAFAGEGNERDSGREVRIDICDTGPGVGDEIRDRIFEPFFTTKQSGTGLGLSIVYQLVENAGGRIELTSGSKGGSVFSIFFPAALFPLAKPLGSD